MTLKPHYIYLFSFAVASFASSCGSAQVVGRYVENKLPNTGNEILIIKNDSTFTYTFLFDVGGTFKFDGRWKLKNKLLVLIQTQPAQNGHKNLSNLIETTNSALNDKRVKVVDARDSSRVAGAQINFNGFNDKTLLTDSDGTVTWPDLIRAIRVRIFDTDTTFTVKNSNSNDFIVALNISNADPWLKEIPTREWRVKANRLVSTSSKKTLTKVK